MCVSWTIFSRHLRFRSIAKSYFRRADGVLLLYDVTCEKSFLNVREWVDMIEVMHYSPLLNSCWLTLFVFSKKVPDFSRIEWRWNLSTLLELQFVLAAFVLLYGVLSKCAAYVHLNIKLSDLACFSLFTCSRYVSVGCRLFRLWFVVILWACCHFCDFWFMHAVCECCVLCDIMHYVHTVVLNVKSILSAFNSFFFLAHKFCNYHVAKYVQQ